jgi:hypothetical protein
MPITETLTGIQTFIACVAQGIIFEIYDRHESTHLLYPAQVALGVPTIGNRKENDPHPLCRSPFVRLFRPCGRLLAEAARVFLKQLH